MKIGICDDNIAERDYLASCCKELGYDDIDLYISGEDYLERNTAPDILFLDIELKDANGLDIRNVLDKAGSHTYIVFYTTHSEQMPDTFGRNVIGFLHKPASIRQVQRYLQKVSYYHKEFSEIILEDRKLPCSELIYLEADNVYTLLHIADNDVLSSRKTIQNWAKELKEKSFFQIHRSYVINLHHIQSILNWKIKLSSGQSLPISRNHRKEFQAAYQKYLLHKAEY